MGGIGAGKFWFTFKLWKEITHNKPLNFKSEDIVDFFRSINSVNEKKGCLLVQFPPGLGREYIIQLEHLLSCINESDPTQTWKLAVEFRNKSWYHGLRPTESIQSDNGHTRYTKICNTIG